MTRSDQMAAMHQITTSYMCAGVGVDAGRVVWAAPILAWTVGKPLWVITAWAKRKGGAVTLIAAEGF
jgi:hypothetical protein